MRGFAANLLEKLCLLAMIFSGIFTLYWLFQLWQDLSLAGLSVFKFCAVILGLLLLSGFAGLRQYFITQDKQVLRNTVGRWGCLSCGIFCGLMLVYQAVTIYKNIAMHVDVVMPVFSCVILVLLLALCMAGLRYFPSQKKVAPQPEKKPVAKSSPQAVPEPVTASPVKPGKFKPDAVSSHPEEELLALTGLQDVKRKVLEIKAVLEYDRANGLNSKSSYNMLFLGAPGTGKTTVARIMAGILYELGVVQRNAFLEVNATEMMGEYLGQTPRLVDDAFKAVPGGVLFIDEAYAFAKSVGGSGQGSFGDEAIIALLSKIEQNPSGTVVIFAGYKNEMNEFLAMNPGLRSRIPYVIDFPDYTVNEMLDILSMDLAKYQHILTEDSVAKLAGIIQAVKAKSENFENGRFARNLAQALHAAHAVNVYQGVVSGTEICLEDIRARDLIGLSSARDLFTDEEIEELDWTDAADDTQEEDMSELVQAVQVLNIQDVSGLTEDDLERAYSSRLAQMRSNSGKNQVTKAYQLLYDYFFK